VQRVQLRADAAVWLPDSAIVYTPTGERKAKHVYLSGTSYGEYAWENGSWIVSSEYPNTEYLGQYDREVFNALSIKVSYQMLDGWLLFYYPAILHGYGYISYYSSEVDFKSEHDVNGNLTSFRFIFKDGNWEEFTITYNAENNPVSIEGYTSYGKYTVKILYEYNNYGYATLFDYYDNLGNWKETAEYDAQGKILFKYGYENGEMSNKYSYEYYDESHISSITYQNYQNQTGTKREWKYGTGGKPEAYYYYENDELSEYVIFYPNSLSGASVEPVSASGVARVWSSGGQLHIEAATNGTAQVYTVVGQLVRTVALTAGQTTVTSLPHGVYIVVLDGKTWKIIV
jgi:hypothetical protein